MRRISGAPLHKVEFPKVSLSSYSEAPVLVTTGRAFYLRLFLLSRKASNATIKLPKDISNISCHWLGRSDSFSFFIIVSLWEVRWLWKNRKIFLKGVDIYDILKIRRIVI